MQLTLFNFNSFPNKYIINEIIFNHLGKFKNVKQVTIRLAFNFRRKFVSKITCKIKSFYELFFKTIKQKYRRSSSNVIGTNSVDIELLWFPSITYYKKWQQFDGINYIDDSIQKCKNQIMKCEQLKYDNIKNAEEMFRSDWDHKKYETKFDKGASKMNYLKHSFTLRQNLNQ